VLLATTLTGTVELSDRVVAELRRALTGPVLLPGDDGYDAARTVWNRMIDRRPALVARCAGRDDVVRAMHFAREHDLLLSVRGGGHNVTGSAVCAGGLMLDLSAMKGTRIDPDARVVTAEPGLTWGEFDAATQRFGLATTGGIVSTTGLAGLTLGGGHGWLMRRHGLTCDNLRAVSLVTADGRIVRASADEHADLFWGVRGGGGNLGIATSFEFRLHPLTRVVAGMLVYPMTLARDVLARYLELTAAAPDDLAVYAILTTWSDGTPVIAVVPCYSGPPERADAMRRSLGFPGAPLLDSVRAMTYGELQTSFDATNPPGPWYYKSGFADADRVGDAGFVDTLLARCDFAAPSLLSRIVVEHLGGAAARIPHDATAFAHRHSPYDLIFIAGGFRPEAAAANVQWARGAWAALRPFMSGGVYVNYLDGDEGQSRIEAAYGATYERLRALKRRYDPDNVFRLNQNVRPG
jgi:FAD/FMN-containing dehydrogenase